MWVEELPNGKYKFFERYKDPYTEKWKRVSVTLESRSARAKKEAQKLLDDKISEILRNLTISDVLFHPIFNEWWDLHILEMKKSSYITQKATITRILDKVEKGTKIKNMNVRLIQSIIDTEDWTYTQKYRVKSMLNVFFDYAQERDYIDSNPARKAKLPPKENRIQKKLKAQNKYLEPWEYKAILKELYRKDITLRYALACEFMLLNGCRIGELVALKIDCFNEKEKTLDIRTTYNRYIPDDNGPKTFASFRTVHLTKREIEIIHKMLELRELSEATDPKWYKSDRIFVTNTGKPIHSSILCASLKRANSRLEKPIEKDIGCHYFRHTMISILAENKVPLKTIMDRVGHADSEVTESIYMHVTRHMKDEAIEILDNAISGII